MNFTFVLKFIGAVNHRHRFKAVYESDSLAIKVKVAVEVWHETTEVAE